MNVRFPRKMGCIAYPDSRTESRIVVAGTPPFGHSVLVEEVVAEGVYKRIASHELLANTPFAFLRVSQNGSDYTEPCKAFVRILHALVLVRATVG